MIHWCQLPLAQLAYFPPTTPDNFNRSQVVDSSWIFLEGSRMWWLQLQFNVYCYWQYIGEYNAISTSMEIVIDISIRKVLQWQNRPIDSTHESRRLLLSHKVVDKLLLGIFSNTFPTHWYYIIAVLGTTRNLRSELFKASKNKTDDAFDDDEPTSPRITVGESFLTQLIFVVIGFLWGFLLLCLLAMRVFCYPVPSPKSDYNITSAKAHGSSNYVDESEPLVLISSVRSTTYQRNSQGSTHAWVIELM